MNTEKWKDISVLFMGSLMLNFWAFYNRFPLVFPDTGTYIYSGFQKFVPDDRPMFYGWFLRHTSLADTLHLSLFFQAIILAYLIWLWLWYFSMRSYQRIQFLVLIFILTFLTGASVQTSQLIPDLFTSTTILALGLLLLVPNMSRWHLIMSSLLLILSLIVHNSHILIVWSALILLALIYLPKWRLLQSKPTAIRIIGVVGLVIFAQLLIPTAHWIRGGEFVTSKASHVFLMNRMVDWGVIDEYLAAECGQKDFKFCEYKDAIPRANFLWDFEGSPLYKTGGWEANKQEYNAILRDIVTSPKYWGALILRTLESTMQQFFSYSIGDTFWDNPENSPPHSAIKQFFPELERSYFWSLQQRKELDFSLLNLHHRYLIGLALSLSFLIMIGKNKYDHLQTLILFTFVLLLANAAVCGVFSGVFDRYQCRVVFLILIPLYILAWKIFPIQHWINKQK